MQHIAQVLQFGEIHAQAFDHCCRDGQRTLSQQVVLKVKRGAFAGLKVQGTVVTVPSRSLSYNIDEPLPRPSSLFDWYALQPRRAAS